MFDFAWSEIGLIAAVALILIGPKDMPVAIRTIADMVKKARRMAGEFQTHVDEMLREANLHEVRDQITSIRNFDIRGEIENAHRPGPFVARHVLGQSAGAECGIRRDRCPGADRCGRGRGAGPDSADRTDRAIRSGAARG